MKSIKIGLCTLCILVLTSCVSTKTFLKNDQIPTDFGKGKSTVIVITSGNKKVDRAVEYAFEKYYKGSFENGQSSLAKKQINETHFYTFNTYTSYNPGVFTSNGRQAPSTDIYFGVTDLKTNKSYKNIRYGNYKKFSKLFVQALEIVRKRNEQ